MRSNLKELRTVNKMTQQQIAEKIGISRTTYTKIELGIANPSFNTAIKIKQVLGFKDDDIFLNY